MFKLSRRTYRLGIAACLLVLLAGGTAHILFGKSDDESQGVGYDDAYISYRYAHNLIRGNGLVFNPGERVEGYSNFSYTLLMSVAFFFTRGIGVYYFSAFLNLFLASAALLVFAVFLREKLGNGLAVVGSLLFALCLPLWAAVGSGLETCLILLIYISIWITTERLAGEVHGSKTALLCILCVLSLLSRADGFLMPGAAILYLTLQRRIRVAMACACTMAIVVCAYEAWRYYYYHALLPTTYYLRVAAPMLWRFRFAFIQLRDIAALEGLLAYLLVFLVASVEVLHKLWRKRLSFVEIRGFDLFLALVWIGYWFFVGGDHVSERFLLILFPLGIFGLLELIATESNVRTAALLVTLIALFEVLLPGLTGGRFQFTKRRYDCYLTAGEFLQKHYPGRSLALPFLGKTPYFLDSYTVDMLGLIDPVIARGPVAAREFSPAHLKFNPDRTLSRRADLLADWIEPRSLDLALDFTRQKYEAAGYHLKYVVYVGLDVPDEAIRDVRGMPSEGIQKLVEKGYTFGILVRE